MGSASRKAKALNHARAVQRKTAGRAPKQRPQVARGGAQAIADAAILQTCGAWELHEVQVSRTWREEGSLTELIVSRRSPTGRIAAAVFLIDLGCFGVKSAFAAFLSDEADYRKRVLERCTGYLDLVPCDLSLAAKIVHVAVAYAASLGFQPDPDIRDAMRVMGSVDPEACTEPVPVGGADGKPICILGPYDDPGAIEQLTAKLGPDGFHFIAGMR